MAKENCGEQSFVACLRNKEQKSLMTTEFMKRKRGDSIREICWAKTIEAFKTQ